MPLTVSDNGGVPLTVSDDGGVPHTVSDDGGVPHTLSDNTLCCLVLTEQLKMLELPIIQCIRSSVKASLNVKVSSYHALPERHIDVL